MKLLTILKTKKAATVITGGLVILGLAGGGVYMAQNKSKQMENNQTQNQPTEDSATNSTNTNDVDNSPSAEGKTSQTPATTTNTTTPQTAANLDDVTIQGTMDASDNILTNIYGSAGVYTVEKQTASGWVSVVSGVNYPGSGGLDLSDLISAGELSRTYRVYKTVNGQKIGPKEIVVDRNLVRTNGSASFPEAQ